MADFQHRLRAAALTYAQRFALSVFPCRPKDKVPLSEHGCKDATQEAKELDAWWSRWPFANVGVATGARSGGLLVLDIDGDEGREALRFLELTHAPLPKTPQVLTGRGKQFYFRATMPLKNRVRVAPGIDIRADGGYVVAPPSIHPNGRVYTWEVSARLDEIPISTAPQWLLDLISGSNPAPKCEPFWKGIAKGAAEGCRNNAAARIAGHLFRQYVDPFLARELVQAWNEAKNRPPLPSHEIERVIESIAGMEARHRVLEGGK